MDRTSVSFQREAPAFDGSVALSEVISALTYALDLTEGAVQGHALRTCLLGMRMAEEIGLSSDQVNSLYFALLLKDVGCSSSGSRPADQRGDRRGSHILRMLGMGELAADAVRRLDERWDGTGHPDRIKGEQIPLLARICSVAQHLDVHCGSQGADEAIRSLIERSGTCFDPQLVGIAASLHRSGTLWRQCATGTSEEDTRSAVLDMDRVGHRQRLDDGQIDQICEAFADVVDAKSHFTFRHSIGVADAALGIARTLGLAPERTQLVRRAALLHDVGKLGVSNTILDKNSPLSDSEWKAVYPHPGATRSVLERIGPFQEMAIIAGEHHEKLDGTGYPNRLMSADLSLESRIIAVADVYGALTEDRPYRAGIELGQTLSIMSSLAPHKLDGDCLHALIEHIAPTENLAVSSIPQLAEPALMYAFESAI